MIELERIVAIGAEARREVLVTPELTVRAAYPSLPEVFATPQMILLMEAAAADAVAALLPAGWGSVGTRVDIRHLAATPVGLTVRATARVVGVTERIVRFECVAHDGIETIGDGFHERAAVELTRFVQRVAAKSGQAQQENPHEQS